MDFGFDPKLAAQAAASLPVYAAAFTTAKRMEFIPRRFEMAAAVVITAAVQTTAAVGIGTPIFAALSASTVGATLAMMLHAMAFKGEPPAKEPTE